MDSLSLLIDIEKVFPDFELSVKLECEDEILALLGSSGCGKSLTLKCIAGIEKPDRGRIIINGETVFDSEKGVNLPPQKRHVGFLFQNYALFPTMTVRQNIYSVIKKPKADSAAIVDDLLKKFQLELVKDLLPRQISGGQQQRVALSRMLASEPKIVLLDEPFSALDTHLRWQVEQEVSSVLADFGGTTILVSHDRSEAYRFSDKIAVMDCGKIRSIGRKEDIFGIPKSLAVALLTGLKNISGARKIDDHTVMAEDWGVTLKSGEIVSDNVKYVAIRAHSFEHSFRERSYGENVFKCRVSKVIDELFETTVEFTFDSVIQQDKTLCFATAKNRFDSGADMDMLYVHIPPDKVFCLDE